MKSNPLFSILHSSFSILYSIFLTLPPLFSILYSLFFISPSPALAVTNPATNPATVTASVPTETTSPPQLLTPADNSYTNNPYELFSWQEATSSAGLHHYTLYLDNTIKLSFLPTNLLSQSNSQYTYSHDDTTAQATLKDPLPEGSHTFHVDAYTNNNTQLQSQTYTFTLDTTAPLIILQKVARHTMYWDTHDTRSIPPFSQRHLTIRTSKPLLKGKVEANSNLKLSLLCPADTSTCQDLTYTLSDPDGNWLHRFRDLKKDLTYTAYLIATDYASNTTYFPPFTVTYQPRPLLPAIPGIIKPKPTPQPTPSPTPAPAKPAPKPPVIPPAPSAPPAPIPSPAPAPTARPQLPDHLNNLIIFGLIIHFLLSLYGSATPILQAPQFTFRLFFPFLPTSPLSHYPTIAARRYLPHHRRQAIPLPLLHSPLSILPPSPPGDTSPLWTTVKIYSAQSQDRIKHVKTIITTITGHFHLPQTLPPMVYLVISHPKFQTLKILQNPRRLPHQLNLSRKSRLSLNDITHLLATHLRLIPLLIALGTSIYAYLITPLPFLLIYAFISLYLLFIEYIYPLIYS